MGFEGIWPCLLFVKLSEPFEPRQFVRAPEGPFGAAPQSCCVCSLACRIAMTRRQMYQRGEDQNKQTGFWGMIKSVTSSPPGSESIHLWTSRSDPWNIYIDWFSRSLSLAYPELTQRDLQHIKYDYRNTMMAADIGCGTINAMSSGKTML